MNKRKEFKYYNKNILKQLIQNKQYNTVADILSLVVNIDKNKNIPVCNFFLHEKRLKVTLSAIYWNKNEPYMYKKISTIKEMDIEEFIKTDKKELRKCLIEQIYYTIIKNEIIMI